METFSKQAEEAQALRDQVDDLRHVADKLEKTERTVDMLKKKAEEANDLRRQLKACVRPPLAVAAPERHVNVHCARSLTPPPPDDRRCKRSWRRSAPRRPSWKTPTGAPAVS